MPWSKKPSSAVLIPSAFKAGQEQLAAKFLGLVYALALIVSEEAKKDILQDNVMDDTVYNRDIQSYFTRSAQNIHTTFRRTVKVAKSFLNMGSQYYY